jgi:hypothetical protein
VLFSQRIKTVAHVVELLNFVQNRVRMQWEAPLSSEAKKGKLQMGLTYVQEP